MYFSSLKTCYYISKPLRFSVDVEEFNVYMYVFMWNLLKMDTNETKESILIREVSSLQREEHTCM